MTEAEIIQLLRVKHSPPEWLFVDHVKNAAGFGSRRALDGLAFNTFGSRGFAVVGYEVKRTRSDLLRELKDPEKAEAVGQFCNRFSIVVPNNMEVDPDELPTGWGLYKVNSKGTGFLTKKQPKERKHVTEIDRPFFAAIVRRIQRSDRADLDEHQRWESFGFRKGVDHAEKMEETNAVRLKELQDRVRDFEQKAGIRIHDWYGRDIGGAVAAVLGKNHDGVIRQARGFLSTLEDATNQQRKAVEQLEALEGAT